jgi:hypothetical protein
MKHITNASQSTSSIPTRTNEIRSASAHIAQAELLILREANEARDPLQVQILRNLAGVLQCLIEQLEATR